MDIYDRKMVTNTKLKYADSSYELLCHHNGTKFKKNLKLKISRKIRILEA